MVWTRCGKFVRTVIGFLNCSVSAGFRSWAFSVEDQWAGLRLCEGIRDWVQNIESLVRAGCVINRVLSTNIINIRIPKKIIIV